MQRANRLSQIKIYTGKCFRIFLNEKGFKIFISAAIITLIICMVTSEDMFATYIDTRNGAFALVCACIWIGIFNSIQSVCKERAIIKREHRSGLHISSYIASHMLYEMALCAVEGVIVTVIICLANMNNLPNSGVLFPTFLELCITFFLIIYSSDALGLMVSSIVKTPNTAMTVMPFVLILQLVMSGMIFELSGLTELVSNLTIAKWGLNVICITANVNAMEGYSPALVADYEYSISHLVQLWLLLILFTVIYGIISVVSLKFVDKDKR
ncbi:MAG: ABC transporter permease [Ruminococcus sp.]|nr:ABC transporter permease [Ruminococcus sp.]